MVVVKKALCFGLSSCKLRSELKGRWAMAAAASFRWLLQLHKDVPKAANFYSQGLDFSVNICTLRWAELQSGPLKLALTQSPWYYFHILAFTDLENSFDFFDDFELG
ncbi:hypothetical protein V6N13_073565 [Hibiscus sabdariffa]|uniref:Uncharacterized protein n=1 Tax=Hibiscus sabdariffa TaxID=183260 RepID=A0ABR2B194_9ROSI